MPSILYIEDDAANIELIRRYLSAINWQFVTAPDGGSGIATAVDMIPDVILLDIYLPDINGLEVAQQIKSIAALAHVPIVALTTDDSPELIEMCYQNGFAEVLHKPVRPHDLLSTVQHMAT